MNESVYDMQTDIGGYIHVFLEQEIEAESTAPVTPGQDQQRGAGVTDRQSLLATRDPHRRYASNLAEDGSGGVRVYGDVGRRYLRRGDPLL